MLFRNLQPLVLASASPRRRDLLASLGISFDIIPAGDEPPPLPHEQPRDYALRAAAAKAGEVASRLPQSWVLGADSVVAVSGNILGKPRDREEALAMLRLLCGGQGPTEHVVCTGFSLQRSGEGGMEQEGSVVSTLVTMDPQPEAVREAYVASEEPMDKAGAYAIQGRGGFLVREIKGSYSNVVGLPLAEVVAILGACGIIVPDRS